MDVYWRRQYSKPKLKNFGDVSGCFVCIMSISLHVTQSNEISLCGCYFTSIWENNDAAPGERNQKSLAAVNILKYYIKQRCDQ